MIKRYFVSFVFLALFLLPVYAWATTYTVCASGCDETAIQDVFDNNDLGAGDIVEIQADVGNAKTYTEDVTITSGDEGSAGAGNDVTIKGKSGDVITIVLSTDAHFHINGADHIIVQDLTITGGGNNGTVQVDGCDDITLRRLHLHDGDGSPQCDGIYLDNSSNIVIEYCRIYNYKCGTSSDCIQAYESSTVTIRYCFLSDDKSGCIMTGSATGTDFSGSIYGNIVIPEEVVGLRLNDLAGTVNVYNNTFLVESSGPDCLDIRDDSSDQTVNIKNNIFIDDGTYASDYCLRNQDANNTNITIDYNIYYDANGDDVILYGGTGYNCSEWASYLVASPHDDNSWCENPDVTDYDNRLLTLTGDSLAVDGAASSPYELLAPWSVWPSNVSTMVGDEIGAFAYSGKTVTIGPGDQTITIGPGSQTITMQ